MNFKNLDGRVALPVLVLAGTGAAIGVAIKLTPGLWENAIALLEKHRRDFVLKVAHVFKDKDRISQLPDDLLSDILSRLNFIEAARTRILSRRWKDICKLRSKLQFDCRKMFGEIQDHDSCSRQHKLRFLKAVDQSLHLYSGQKIPYLILACCLGKEFVHNINKWMQSIATLGVEELLIKFCSPIHVDNHGNGNLVDFFPFPFELLFEAASLKNLHLLSCVLRPTFKGQFKSLEFLTLSMVPLDSLQLPSILSCCPNLQGMRVAHCRLPSKLCISGQCLRLKFMLLELCRGVKDIEIHAGNLIYFYCYTDETINYSFDYVPKLEKLSLSFNGSGTVPYLFGEVAKDCTQLRYLLLQTKTDELPDITAKINMFSNLRILYLLMMLDSKVNLINVTPILDACPLLEQFRVLVSSCIYLFLDIQLIAYLTKQRLQMARCPTHSEQRGGIWPVRHYARLKEVELDGFQGTRKEIEFASFLLQSACALERLRIRSSYSTYSADFQWTEHTDHTDHMTDEELQLIYKRLMGSAPSSKVKVIFS